MDEAPNPACAWRLNIYCGIAIEIYTTTKQLRESAFFKGMLEAGLPICKKSV